MHQSLPLQPPQLYISLRCFQGKIDARQQHQTSKQWYWESDRPLLEYFKHAFGWHHRQACMQMFYHESDHHLGKSFVLIDSTHETIPELLPFMYLSIELPRSRSLLRWFRPIHSLSSKAAQEFDYLVRSRCLISLSISSWIAWVVFARSHSVQFLLIYLLSCSGVHFLNIRSVSTA